MAGGGGNAEPPSNRIEALVSTPLRKAPLASTREETTQKPVPVPLHINGDRPVLDKRVEAGVRNVDTGAQLALPEALRSLDGSVRRDIAAGYVDRNLFDAAASLTAAAPSVSKTFIRSDEGGDR